MYTALQLLGLGLVCVALIGAFGGWGIVGAVGVLALVFGLAGEV